LNFFFYPKGDFSLVNGELMTNLFSFLEIAQTILLSFSQNHHTQAEIKISFPRVSTSESKQKKPIPLDRSKAVKSMKNLYQNIANRTS